MTYFIYYNLYISHVRTKKKYFIKSKLLISRWLYVSDLNVLGQSPRHNMWLLQYILYRILLFNTDCYNIMLNKISDSDCRADINFDN